MIKNLTIALLLLATGTLFAQISNPVPTTFLVKSLEGVEADLLVDDVRGWMGDSARDAAGDSARVAAGDSAAAALAAAKVAAGDSLQQDPLALTGAVTVDGVLTTKDSLKIGTFEDSTFRDLNIKQTNVSKAIRIEERTGTEAYEIGIGTDGTFALYDDDGSLSFYIVDGTNLVVVEDSIWVKKTSRFGGNAKFESDVLVEGDLDVQGQFTSTLSLNLAELFGRNVVQFMVASRDDSTADSNWDGWDTGTAEVNTTTHLVGGAAVDIIVTGANQGGYLDFTNRSFANYTDNDTSTTADYINVAFNIDADNLDSLHADGVLIQFICDDYSTVTNRYYKAITKASFSAGWILVKIAKSAFVESGSPSWGDIRWLLINFSSNQAKTCTLTVDGGQMVRKAAGSAEPNWAQTETTQGTWREDLTQEGNGNVWLVEESGVLSIMFPENLGEASTLLSAKSYGDYTASGKIKCGTAYPIFFSFGVDCRWMMVGNTTLRFGTSTEYRDYTTTHVSYAAGDDIWWEATRNDSTFTVQVSEDQINWDMAAYQASGSVYASPMAPEITGYNANERKYGFGLSSVAYAIEAGVAQRLKDLQIVQLPGTTIFKFIKPDSTHWFHRDSVTVTP